MVRLTQAGKQHTVATVGGLLAIGLWSTTVAFARSLSEQLGPVTAAAAVYVVAAVPATLRMVRLGDARRNLQQLNPRYLFGCGTLFVSYMLLLFLAVGLAGDKHRVLEVGLLNYLWPVLTVLFSVVLLNQRASWLLPAGLILGLVGIVLVLTQGHEISPQSFWQNVQANPGAYLLGLAAGITWALYSALTSRWARGTPGAVNWFLLATALAMVLACLLVDEPRQWTAVACAEAAFLGIATNLAYRLWDAAMRRGNVMLVASASYLTPLLSTVVTSVYLAVLPGPQLWIGCVLLVTGSLLSWISVSAPAD